MGKYTDLARVLDNTPQKEEAVGNNKSVNINNITKAINIPPVVRPAKEVTNLRTTNLTNLSGEEVWIAARGCYELWLENGSIWAWILENHTQAMCQTKSGRSSPLTSRSLGRTPLNATTICARSSTDLQRTEVDSTHRLRVEIHAPRPSSVGGPLPANPAVDKSGSVRGDGPRFARAVAAFGREGVGAHGGHTRLSHPQIHSRERASGRL